MSDENEFPLREHVSPTDPTVPNIPPPVSPTNPTVPNPPSMVSPTDPTVPNIPAPPVWPPPQMAFRRRETFPRGRSVMFMVLALILIGGGLGFILLAATNQYQSSLRNQATTVARQARTTAVARSAGTANAFSTKDANIYDTATAQVGVTATLTAQSDDATATATTLGNVFTQATSGTAALNDPLSDNTGNNKWDETSNTVAGQCVFTGGSYHVIEARLGYLQPCIAEATTYSNFVYQVQMLTDKGNQGGILFYATSSKGSFYFFRIGIDGSYALDLYKSATQGVTLVQGFSPAITIGLAQSNQIAVIAMKGMLYLYVNQQYVTGVADSTLTSGSIGVAALDNRNPTTLEFSNAEVWNITSLSFNPTPTPTTGTPTATTTVTATTTPTATTTVTATATP